MAGRLSYGDWLNLMADACGMDRSEFEGLSAPDRRELLAAASGMAWDDFAKLRDSVAQVEAIRKHSGSNPPPPPKVGGKTNDPNGDADKQQDGGEGSPSEEQSEEPGEPAEGEGTPTEGEDEGADGVGELELPPSGNPDDQEFEPQFLSEETREAITNAIKHAHGSAVQTGTEHTNRVAMKLAEALEKRLEAEVVKLKAEGLGNRTITIKVADAPPVKIDDHVHPVFDRVARLAALGLPIMLVGPAGTGKTTLGRQVAKALGRAFGSVSCTAGMSEGELVGKLLPGEDGGFVYRPSQFVTLYEGGGVFLVDEIDAADPNVLLKVNQSIGSVQGGGLWHNDLRYAKPEVRQHKDFVMIAAANTFGTGAGAQYVGRNQLDAATLDRFAVVEVDYDKEFEAKVGDKAICEWLWLIREKTANAKLRRVVSTRAIERCTMMKAQGMKAEDVREMFFASWTKDEIAKVGGTALPY